MNKDQGKRGWVKDYFTRRIFRVMSCTVVLCFSLGYFWSTSNHTWQYTPVKTFSTMRIIYTKPQILRQPPNTQDPDDFHKINLLSNRTYLLENLLEIELPRMIYAEPQVLKPPRNDVLMMTPWFAPIVWEGTYNLEILNEQFKQRNVTVGLTVFAIKKYVVFLKTFLETAEMYFMVGHKVNYYIFTDRPQEVPKVELKEGRNVVVLQVQNYSRWQEISMRRMEMINHFSKKQFINEVDYLVCVDVDMRFNDLVGVEILSNLFGTLHPGFYGAERQSFTYERRPASQAYVPHDEGDFYYAGGFFGGTIKEVYKLTKKCHEAIMVDKDKRIEAIWQEESHLNKYFVYHKPTKILSPEYVWDDNMGRPEILRKRRFLAVPKNHAAIRNK
ncbi:histo-blood group ABO system transferase-like isoform X1 [Pelodiscus sinensis]|uniref:histo-blood group ABO system transferase-like isoform X1 n=1 Tax=Pelodiscus sinensis TaxID=13735 RepID=UPI003F6AE82A